MLFQLANACFCACFLAPNDQYGLLFLHGVGILGFLLFSTWAWNIICAADVFAWNFGLMLVNVAQMLYILYQMRPVRFPHELDEVYTSLFEPMQVSRQLFKKLVSMEHAQIFTLHAGEAYAMQNLTRADRLSLLISGRVNVMSDNRLLHHIYAKQFMDSPEFEATGPGSEEKFKVTIMAAAPSRYVSWQRDTLDYLFVKETYLAHIMSILIARDITTKLYAMNEKIITDKGSQMDIRLPSITSSMATSFGGTITTTQQRSSSGRSVRTAHSNSATPSSAHHHRHHHHRLLSGPSSDQDDSPAAQRRTSGLAEADDSVFDSKEKLVLDEEEAAVDGEHQCHPHSDDSETKNTDSTSSTEEQYTAINETWPVTA